MRFLSPCIPFDTAPGVDYDARMPDAALAVPDSRGTYVLMMTIATDLTFVAGALGEVRLLAGQYAYVGSALGPGGLASRVNRHCQAIKPLRWHIDYLTALAPVSRVLTCSGSLRLECAWAASLLALPGATAPARRFGASDCRGRCPAHLIRLPNSYHPDQLESFLWPIST